MVRNIYILFSKSEVPIAAKDQEMYLTLRFIVYSDYGVKREISLKEEIERLTKVNDGMDRTLTLMKAKEYDKVDVLKKAAEIEAKLKYISVDNENLSKERN